MPTRRAITRVLAAVAALAALPGLAVTTAAGAAAPADRPNIVVITTDDQNVGDLRHMPFTRQLVGAAGTSFSDAVSTFPLCCPARATILTGQHAHNHGVLANNPPVGGWEKLRPQADRLLPVWLSEAGYRTTFAGKFLNTYGHDDRTEVPPGWDDWHAFVRRVYDYHRSWVNENGTLVDHTGEYQADVVQDVVEDAIRAGVEDERPFFIWQSNLAPHGACTAGSDGCRWGPPTPAAQDLGTFADLPLPAERRPSFDERVILDKPGRMQELPRLRPARVRALRTWNRRAAESLQAVDRNVRATVELLEELGELENTLIVFTSDNGHLRGEHRWRGKTLAYEPSLRIPLLMRGPGVPAGAVVDETVALVDLAATVAEAAGAEPLLTLDGISLRDVAAGVRPGYDVVSIEAGPELGDVPLDQYLYRGVRTARYTYLEHPVTGEVELYDRHADPHQLDNVAYRPTHRATRAALAAALAVVQDCVGATCHRTEVEVPEPAPAQGPVHPDQLASSEGVGQLVTITAPRWKAKRATAVAWQRRGRTWRAVRGPVPVRLGEAGMSAGPRRAAGATPAGAHRVVHALGARPAPPTRLRYRRIGERDRLPHDPAATGTYNVLQGFRSPLASWRPGREVVFADHPGSFDRGLVLDFNRPRRTYWAAERRQRVARVPADVRRGSLLLHTGSPVPGRGWVSMRVRDLTWLIRWADPAGQATTLVVGTPRHLRSRL